MLAYDTLKGSPQHSICLGLPDPNFHLLSLIRNWLRIRGRDLPEYWELSRIDERFGRYCAEVQERASHTPLEFRTASSYAALIAEIREQFQSLVEGGYTVALWMGAGQPYWDSRDMRVDVRDHRHLFVYPTSGLSPDHPLAQAAMDGWCWNDVFRAVHDLVGHAATGFQFGPVGEENAFRFQAMLHSPAAISALAAETRLQNSWVNFGAHLWNAEGKLVRPGEPGYLSPAVRPYAAQKAFSPVAGAIDCSLWRASSSSLDAPGRRA